MYEDLDFERLPWVNKVDCCLVMTEQVDNLLLTDDEWFTYCMHSCVLVNTFISNLTGKHLEGV